MTANTKYRFNNSKITANVLITGGNGAIGKYLSETLLSKGYAVACIGRKAVNDYTYIWDIKNKEIEKGALENADFIIHLAGAGIADKRWSVERKKEILDSRIKSAQLIYNYIHDNNLKIKAFISASAIGYYGAVTSDTIFNEEDAPAIDFLGSICSKWDAVTMEFTNLNIRAVALRTGIVLMNSGGALQKMITPIKLGIGSSLGSGKQYLPWIHITDLSNMYIKAIEDDGLNGVYNAVAPQHIDYKQFGKIAAKILNKPFFFPNVPAFVLKLVFGKMSVVLLKGSRVSSHKIVSKNFKFQFPKLEIALQNLLKK